MKKDFAIITNFPVSHRSVDRFGYSKMLKAALILMQSNIYLCQFNEFSMEHFSIVGFIISELNIN